MRCLMIKDFVPYFLGARSRSRDFFIGHNNVSSEELHQLDGDTLSIVVDSTYTRIEKSANNQFQYDSWSSQKLDLLLKPFIMCCTDGYFIDCYGPFKANMNDATIFNYILETDESLNDILKPDKTIVFLDRGNSFVLLKYHYLTLTIIKASEIYSSSFGINIVSIHRYRIAISYQMMQKTIKQPMMNHRKRDRDSLLYNRRLIIGLLQR